ncbi:MAG: hypothetical protein RBR35_10235, partial [Salinivirgaceae bacterium]|nr:hypothetical protein [Salinivirgaceae bacterium]
DQFRVPVLLVIVAALTPTAKRSTIVVKSTFSHRKMSLRDFTVELEIFFRKNPDWVEGDIFFISK